MRVLIGTRTPAVQNLRQSFWREEQQHNHAGSSTAHLQHAHFCWIHLSLNYRLKCGQWVTGVFSFSLFIVIHSLHAEHSSVRLPVVAVLSVLCVSPQLASGQHQSWAKWAMVAWDFTCNSSGEATRMMVKKKDSMNSRNRQKITKKNLIKTSVTKRKSSLIQSSAHVCHWPRKANQFAVITQHKVAVCNLKREARKLSKQNLIITTFLGTKCIQSWKLYFRRMFLGTLSKYFPSLFFENVRHYTQTVWHPSSSRSN